MVFCVDLVERLAPKHRLPIESINDLIEMNNSRMWENKGYTPSEMAKLLYNNEPNEHLVCQSRKVVTNDLQQQDNSKKDKKSSSIIENNRTAQLSYDERIQFYETWLKLLDFVNRKLNVVNYQFDLTYPSDYDESLIHKIREKLWENLNLISEYVATNVTISDEELILLRSWEKHFIKGRFVLLKYTRDYAIFMRADQDEKAMLYAVKGIKTLLPIPLSVKYQPCWKQCYCLSGIR